MCEATTTKAPAANPAADWPLFNQAKDIAGALVEKELGALLRNNSEESTDDVVARAVARVWKSYGKFDPLKATFSTFVGRITRWVIGDVKRRHARRQKLVAERPDTRPTPEHTTDPDPEPKDLVEWLRETYGEICGVIRTAKRSGPPPRGPGGRPKVYTAQQACAIRALQRKLNLSDRGVEAELQRRPELRAAIGLGKVPSYRSIHRGKESVTKLKKSFEASMRSGS